MEINLFSQCIKDLIVENDRVDVPYLGTFTAEMVPASYSDRQTTIHPPYRKMSFRKGEVSMDEGQLVLGKVMQVLGVSQEQAGVELGWCLSRLSSELEGRKSCRLPGLGVMRANARNEFFFVPDDDLDIWPDGLGLEPVSIKVSEKPEEEQPVVEETPGQAGTRAEREPRPEGENDGGGQAGTRPEGENDEAPKIFEPAPLFGQEEESPENPVSFWRVALIVLAVLVVLFIAASYLFTDEMSPILDRLLYSKEELELLRGR